MLPISVVIPTYQRPKALRRCLEGLAQQTFAVEQFEVIVVDDGSAIDWDTKLRATYPFSLQIVRQANQGPAAARNHGVSLARGQWIAFTDDDCVPTQTWLAELWAARPVEGNCVGLGGRTIRLKDQLFGRFIDWFGSLQPGQKPDGQVRYVVTCNAMLLRSALEAVGGFDTRITWAGGEEPILGAALLAKGYCMEITPQAKVLHEHPDSIPRFFKMYVRYGQGEKAGSQLQARTGYHGNLPYFIKLFFLDNWRILTDRSLPGKDRIRFCFLTLIKALGNVWGWMRQGQIATEPNEDRAIDPSLLSLPFSQTTTDEH